MKKIKRMSLLVVTFIAILFGSTMVFAASQKSKAISAYKKYMASEPSTSEFALIYLDNDSVPELVFRWKGFTFRNGKMKELKPSGRAVFSSQYVLAGFEGYYKKTGILRTQWGGGDFSWIDYYAKMNGTKVKAVLAKSTVADPITDYNNITYHHEYYRQSGSAFKEMKSKSQFNNALKKYINNNKYIKIKFRKNTASNRKKYLK